MESIEPYRQIVELQSEIVRISRRNADLKRKCGELEERLVESRERVKPSSVQPDKTEPRDSLRVPRNTIASFVSNRLKTLKSVRSLLNFGL